MSVELCFAFAVTSALLLVMPGKDSLLPAYYAASRKRSTALYTAPAAALGLVTAMLPGAALSASAAFLSPTVLSIIGWLGIFMLIIMAISIPAIRIVAAPKADNDNLRERQPMRIFTHVYAANAINHRNVVFFAAIIPQFIASQRTVIANLVQMQAALLVVSLVAAVLCAVFSAPLLVLANRIFARKPRKRTARRHFIAARAVYAGYRRIAA